MRFLRDGAPNPVLNVLGHFLAPQKAQGIKVLSINKKILLFELEYTLWRSDWLRDILFSSKSQISKSIGCESNFTRTPIIWLRSCTNVSKDKSNETSYYRIWYDIISG
jgi:hypothetical protein